MYETPSGAAYVGDSNRAAPPTASRLHRVGRDITTRTDA